MLFHPSSPVILPVPHRQQSQNGECLATCTAMILLNDPAFPEAPMRVPTADFYLAWYEQKLSYAVLSVHNSDV
jgi:hypothetical protein